METAFNKKSIFSLSAKRREILFDVVTFIFIMLFVYTASSKLMAIEGFIKVLGKSPLLGHFNLVLAYAIPAIELVLSLMLLINQSKRLGLILSLLLMVIFTVYLIYMVSSASTLPCMCGGVINTMTWKQHIFFNIAFIAMAITALKLYK